MKTINVVIYYRYSDTKVDLIDIGSEHELLPF